MRRMLFALGLCLIALPSWALTLEEAKQKGYVGERADGYLGLAAPGAPAEARDLVDRVNRDRRDHYGEIAKRNNADPRAVESVAGKRLLEMTPSGGFIMDGSGGWRRK